MEENYDKQALKEELISFLKAHKLAALSTVSEDGRANGAITMFFSMMI